MSKVAALYHIVFCTKYRQFTIENDLREELFRFIWTKVKEFDSRLIRINCIPNHVHLLIDLNPNHALKDVVSKIKSATSQWLRKDERFPHFKGWAKEYFASSVSPENQEIVIRYIMNQQEHHKIEEFDKELWGMCTNAYLQYHENDLKE